MVVRSRCIHAIHLTLLLESWNAKEEFSVIYQRSVIDACVNRDVITQGELSRLNRHVGNCRRSAIIDDD